MQETERVSFCYIQKKTTYDFLIGVITFAGLLPVILDDLRDSRTIILVSPVPLVIGEGREEPWITHQR